MKKHRFYKDNEGWFIDLPSFPGPKSALAMVAGADTLLDKVSGWKEEVILAFHDSEFSDADFMLQRVKVLNMGLAGADYFAAADDKQLNDHKLWLCSVTIYVFGYYPNKIWVRKV